MPFDHESGLGIVTLDPESAARATGMSLLFGLLPLSSFHFRYTTGLKDSRAELM